jgi:hypothetical protein
MLLPGFHASASVYGGTNVYRAAAFRQAAGAVRLAQDTCTCTSPSCAWTCPQPPPPDPCTKLHGKPRCLCDCTNSTGRFAPPSNLCSGPNDPYCDDNCNCICFGIPGKTCWLM